MDFQRNEDRNTLAHKKRVVEINDLLKQIYSANIELTDTSRLLLKHYSKQLPKWENDIKEYRYSSFTVLNVLKNIISNKQFLNEELIPDPGFRSLLESSLGLSKDNQSS